MLKITQANETHRRYFTQEVLEHGAGYAVSDENAVIGLFSFLINDKTAILKFPFCLNQEAIALAVETFIKDYPYIEKIICKSAQKLDKLGFHQQILNVKEERKA